MEVDTQPLMAWIRWQRRTNDLKMDLMTHHFDLDGALAADQPELAWHARECILLAAVELSLRNRGVALPDATGRSARAGTVVRTLTDVDAAAASDVWELLSALAPRELDAVRADVARVLEFVRTRLGVPAFSRDAAVRAWADGAKLLREVATELGLAQSEGWYLHERVGSREHLNWYDEVVRRLDTSAT